MKELIFYPFYAYAMKIYHKDRDYEKANKFYQIAERFYPNHTENLFKIGMCYKKCRNYREASKYFEKALELDTENEKYKEQLQIARMRDFILFAPTKLWWQEIIVLEQKIKEKGEKYELLLNLAEDCLAMRHYDKAAEAYQRAIALCKEKERLPQLYYEMGYAYENADKSHLQLAKEAYAQAIRLDEELEAKRYGIGVFHRAKERWRFANRAFLEKVESFPPRHCEDDRTKQSIIPHTCDSAIASLREMSKANDEAIHHQAYLKDSIVEAKGEISDNGLPRFLAESRNDESQPVIASASEAIYNPAYPKASDDLLLNKVGESFERLYDWESALKYYQQSLELNYQNPQTHLRLGFVYERRGNYQQAVESYTQGLQRNNALNAYWVYRLGFCLNQLGKFQEASKTLLGLRVTDAYPLLVGGGGLYDQCLAE